jgi:hypothetical protein
VGEGMIRYIKTISVLISEKAGEEKGKCNKLPSS